MSSHAVTSSAKLNGFTPVNINEQDPLKSATISKAIPPFAFDSSFKSVKPDENLVNVLRLRARRDGLIRELIPQYVDREVKRWEGRIGSHQSDVIYSAGLCALNQLITTWDGSVPLHAYISKYFKNRLLDEVKSYDRSVVDYALRAKINSTIHEVKNESKFSNYEDVMQEVANKLGITQDQLGLRLQRVNFKKTVYFSDLEKDDSSLDKYQSSRIGKAASQNNDAAKPINEQKTTFDQLSIEGRENLEKAINSVSGLARVIAKLRLLNDISMEEIHELVGVSLFVVRKLYKAACSRISNTLNGESKVSQAYPDYRREGKHLASAELASIATNSVGFFLLLRDLRAGKEVSTLDQLSEYYDNPDFYTLFLASRDKDIKAVRRKVLQHPLPKLSTLSPHAEATWRDFILAMFPTLDKVSANFIGAKLAHCPYNIDLFVAKHLVNIGAISPAPLQGHCIQQANGNLTRYLNIDVVSPEQYFRNRKQLLQELFPTLDHINEESLPRNGAIRKLITGKDNSTLIECAQALIEQRIISVRMPLKHELIKLKGNEVSLYFNSEIVGKVALLNVKRYLKRNFKTLDDIPHIVAIANALDCDKYKIPQKVVELGWYPSKIPDGHSISTKGRELTRYMKNDVIVDDEQRLQNIHKYIKYTFPNPDSIRQEVSSTYTLQNLLGLAPGSTTELAAYAFKHGLYGWEMPHELPLLVGTRLSFYLDINTLPRQFIRANLKNWVEHNMPTADKVYKSKALVCALNNSRNDDDPVLPKTAGRPVILAELQRRGWL